LKQVERKEGGERKEGEWGDRGTNEKDERKCVASEKLPSEGEEKEKKRKKSQNA
jgi:hypothetical protein